MYFLQITCWHIKIEDIKELPWLNDFKLSEDPVLSMKRKLQTYHLRDLQDAIFSYFFAMSPLLFTYFVNFWWPHFSLLEQENLRNFRFD